MRDEVRHRLKHIGSVQAKIILWLGTTQGVRTLEDLRRRWPAKTTVKSAFNILTELQEPKPVPTAYAPYLQEEYFLEQDERELALEGDNWIRWDPGEVLGAPPSQTESVALSKGIRSLEERELVETAKVAGKGKRISHVKLTFYGEVAAVLLRNQR